MEICFGLDSFFSMWTLSPDSHSDDSWLERLHMHRSWNISSEIWPMRYRLTWRLGTDLDLFCIGPGFGPLAAF